MRRILAVCMFSLNLCVCVWVYDFFTLILFYNLYL